MNHFDGAATVADSGRRRSPRIEEVDPRWVGLGLWMARLVARAAGARSG
jgi:hypothetical protein